MKLIHARIHGFGKWVDDEIDLSGERAICIYGENESGKSTLQKFILFMLFGLPPKQRSFYRPKTSGKMGGRLRIYDPSVGNYTIERFDEVRNGAAICYGPGGHEYGEDWLKERLKGMTDKTYQAIFSFSASDLNSLKDMKEDDLGEVLLGIGLTGSTNIYAIEKRLDTRIGELFKPYGKKPAINQQLQTLNELFTSLHNFKADEATYRKKQAEKISLTKEITELKGELQQEKEILFSIERQQQALPIIHDYHDYTSQLAKYPSEITFPENGIDRMEKLKDQLLPLESEFSVLTDNQEKYMERKANIQTETDDISIYHKTEEITLKKQHYEERQNELEKVQRTADKLEAQIKSEINQLNIGIMAEELNRISFPFHLEKTWNQIKGNNDQLELEKDQLEQEQNQLKQQRNYLLNQMDQLTDGLLTDEHRSKLEERINEHKEYDLLSKLQSESHHKQKEWEKNKATKIKTSTFTLVGSIILALLVGTISVVSEITWMLSLTAILLAIGIGQWIWSKRSVAEMETLLTRESFMPSDVSQQTPVEREEAERLLALHHRRSNELASLEEQSKSIDIQLIKWKEKQKVLIDKESRLQTLIEEQQEIYPFLRQMAIFYWPELFHSMKHLLRLVQEQRENQQIYEQLKEQQEIFHVDVNRFFQERSWELGNKQLEIQLKEIEDYQENYKNKLGQLDQYKHILAENSEQQQEIKQKMKTYEIELAALLKHADVDTEDEFYRKANQLTTKLEVEEARKKVYRQLMAIFPPDIWQQLVDDQPDESTLEMKHQQSLGKIETIEKDIEQIRQTHADLHADLLKMESSESHSRTIHQFEMEQEQLNKLAKDWAVLKTAKEMLVETKRNYREKYLSKVIEKTSYYFRELTGSAYQAVYAPTENKPFQVETEDNLRYTVNELSQGTMDQLYISLRFAISEIMSEKYRLPFIIDDGFVHFDAIRTNQMMGIVEEIAKKQQVILFTCKKEVAEASKNVEIIHLRSSIRIN
ncbi:hypothetical protein CIL05_12995 [Virgibacillus profundi]|uniref:YhaN AAA domain-containing protein n=1 Tax=Virgibacillus profundi TaxID=2024555 RepID=A0A2A2IDA9_9BACI|nr:AAA family ATPase [Virgibacillus profundi]PAV29306.1 hypothetical protein CIL05_12995 [Virgibacillus profundi]PXY53475.1 hypothetical protein CIT14_13120 [Virgibacillus profundi]